VDELGPAEFKSNERFAKPQTVRLVLPADLYVYEIRSRRLLGKRKELSVTLDPYEPSVFAFSSDPLPALRLGAPSRLARGESGRIAVSFASASPAAAHILHVDVLDPSGKPVPQYSGNLLAPEGHSGKLLPVAYNDPPGRWTIRATDLLSGQEQTVAVEVF
jgi:hypothetical protein